jgi:hypothetical protein
VSDEGDPGARENQRHIRRRRWIVGAVLALAAVVMVPAFVAVRFFGWLSRPLGESPRLTFASSSLSDQEKLDFLNGEFQTINDVRKLPKTVVHAFTEEGGSRFTIVNPGAQFQATDVVIDASLPNKRLVFAGVTNGKCFVQYEQGGIGLSDALILFRLTSPNQMQPVWRGYCGPAHDLTDLRSQIKSGSCSNSVPKEMR